MTAAACVASCYYWRCPQLRQWKHDYMTGIYRSWHNWYLGVGIPGMKLFLSVGFFFFFSFFCYPGAIGLRNTVGKNNAFFGAKKQNSRTGKIRNNFFSRLFVGFRFFCMDVICFAAHQGQRRGQRVFSSFDPAELPDQGSTARGGIRQRVRGGDAPSPL